MALQLEDDAKEDQCDEHRVRVVLSPAHDRLALRDQTPPSTCPALCGPRSCATLPPTLRNSEPKKRRLWGLRGLVKMFRRRTRRKGMDPHSMDPHSPIPTLRTRSASELAVDQSINRSSAGPYNQGLSVSHDSVFSPESPTEEQHTSTSNLALATRGVNMAELKAALRRRRMDGSDSLDDDPGLPRSPPTSPNAFDISCHGFKNSSRATQSSCSDASLLSMGSSYDEDSFGSLSHHSSRASLIEGRNYSIDNEPAVGTVTLNHNAARHKMAVRPRRTHAISKMRKQTPMASSSLPTTIEVNEESMHKSSQSISQESHVTVRCSKENLTSIGEFHAREAVEALVVELVTEKSKSYFSRSVEEKRSSHVTSLESGVCRSNLVPMQTTIHAEETSSTTRPGCNTERNKSDATAFSKRISVGENLSWTSETVCTQRVSGVEGLLEMDKPGQHCFASRAHTKESHTQLRNNLITSIMDVVPPPVNSPPKAVSPSRRNLQPDLNVNGEQSCKIVLPGPNLSEEHTKMLLGSAHNRQSRSSIDNLTTTLLPGIYIRPFSPSKTPDAVEENIPDGNCDTKRETTCSIATILPCVPANVGHSEIKPNGNASPLLPEEVPSPSSDCKAAEAAKKVAREPSFTSHVETKAGKVPEFMRVQLNRVKSFNSPAALNATSGEPPSVVPVERDVAVGCVSSKATGDQQKTSPDKPPRKDKLQEPAPAARETATAVDHSFVSQVAEGNSAISSTGDACPPKEDPKPKDEIVLRRPSLLDKSVILDQSVYEEGGGGTKGRSNQPELFKVFARRSFKLKEDNAEESSKSSDEGVAACKEDTTPTVASPSEPKKEEVKPQQTSAAAKRYSIGSCPLPFGTRLSDAATIAVKAAAPPSEHTQPPASISPSAAAKAHRIVAVTAASSGIDGAANGQKPATAPSTDSEALQKVAFSRRSFSHVALKPAAAVAKGSPLARTSSANQSDFVCTSAIINRANASNSDKSKDCVRTVLVDTKPAVTTKPVVWPPAKPALESSPPAATVAVVEAVVNRQPVVAASTLSNATKVSSDIVARSESARQPEGKENQSKLSNRFSGDALRKVSLAEAKNSTFAQSMIVESVRRDSLGLKNESAQNPASNEDPSDDWRVLVRRRREDRLKHTKSMDADEIIMETRPNANRSSKVLEMANNFQKLQVA